jgi:hypothetical protein
MHGCGLWSEEGAIWREGGAGDVDSGRGKAAHCRFERRNDDEGRRCACGRKRALAAAIACTAPLGRPRGGEVEEVALEKEAAGDRHRSALHLWAVRRKKKAVGRRDDWLSGLRSRIDLTWEGYMGRKKLWWSVAKLAGGLPGLEPHCC